MSENSKTSRNGKIAFWVGFFSFSVVATVLIGLQGAFDRLHLGGSFILVLMYLCAVYFLHLFIVRNPGIIDRWFGKSPKDDP